MKNSNQNATFGYIEVYYGKLLNWEDRYKIIKKMHLHNMNNYLYAPKEDIYHRISWRKKYPRKWLEDFKKFCKFAKKKQHQYHHWYLTWFRF